jgi:hypothetical protein
MKTRPKCHGGHGCSLQLCRIRRCQTGDCHVVMTARYDQTRQKHSRRSHFISSSFLACVHKHTQPPCRKSPVIRNVGNSASLQAINESSGVVVVGFQCREKKKKKEALVGQSVTVCTSTSENPDKADQNRMHRHQGAQRCARAHVDINLLA